MRLQITMLMACYLVAGGVRAADKLSVKDLQKKKTPSWAKPKAVKFDPNKPWQVFGRSRLNTSEMKKSTARLMYAIKKSDKSPVRPFFMTKAAHHFVDLDQDQAAFQLLLDILRLPASTPASSRHFGGLDGCKNEARFFLARILARNGHSKHVEKGLKSIKISNGYDIGRQAEILALVGETDKAIALLPKVNGGGHPERGFSDFFLRIRAGCLARTLGDDKLAMQVLSPLVKKGIDSQNWPQYKSSWSIAKKISDNASTGKKPELTGLKNGSYSASCRGFVDMIGVSVKVSNGEVSQVKITKTKEDRPFSSLDVIPDRIVRRKNLTVDVVSGATVTSCAINAAVDEALMKARKK